MIAQTQSSSALKHAKRQQIEHRIKQLNLSLIKLAAERFKLKIQMQELDKPEPLPEPEVLAPLIRPPPVVHPATGPKTGRKGNGGRQKIFTPEVLAQIPLWIAQGFTREEIATRLGAKVSSLQVVCCKHKISLWPQNGRRKAYRMLSPQPCRENENVS